VSLFSTADFREQQTVQLGHDFRLGAEGLGISSAFTYAWARPDIEDADVRAQTLLGTIEAGYPLVRSQANTVRGSLGLDIINQDVELDDIDLTRDRLRVAFARIGWDSLSMNFSAPGRSLAEPLWRLSTLLELRKGLDLFGATQRGENIPASRSEGRATAAAIRYSVYGELRPVRLLTLALGARAQYAWKPLLSFEEFSAGNYTAGRGYDPGSLIGDRGFGTQAELRFGSRIPSSAKRAAVESYAFWDHALVRNLDRLVEVEGSRRINSVGGGARINFDRFALDTTLAVPLTQVGLLDRKPDPRLLISLTSRLWPWSYQ
jgi:hemolysin activation/secretion protein